MHTYWDTQASLQALDSVPDELLEPVCNPCWYLENKTGYVRGMIRSMGTAAQECIRQTTGRIC
jgi:hypothetical protein